MFKNSAIHHTLILLFILTAMLSCNVNNDDEFQNAYTYKIQQQAHIETNSTRREITPHSSLTVLHFSVEQPE